MTTSIAFDNAVSPTKATITTTEHIVQNTVSAEYNNQTPVTATYKLPVAGTFIDSSGHVWTLSSDDQGFPTSTVVYKY